MKKDSFRMITALLLSLVLVTGCGAKDAGIAVQADRQAPEQATKSFSLADIPEFSREPYVVLNDNEPEFSEEDYAEESYEYYSELDELGRCGAAIANIGPDLMPTEKRGSISQVKPSGWHSVQYDWVDGKSLYNRCHLIGYQLTAENANERNLITGTRYLNVEGMLPFENMVADYIKETDNHVLYRVTPIFEGDHLVASGVQMEAKSVEDAGEGICFHIYAYNYQPGVVIDYATGDSYAAEEETTDGGGKEAQEKTEYILNTNTRKFHLPSCSSVEKIQEANREIYRGKRKELIDQGYEPCKTCKP